MDSATDIPSVVAPNASPAGGVNWVNMTRIGALAWMACTGVQLAVLALETVNGTIVGWRGAVCLVLLLAPLWLMLRQRSGAVLTHRITLALIATGAVQVSMVSIISGADEGLRAMVFWILLAASVQTRRAFWTTWAVIVGLTTITLVVQQRDWTLIVEDAAIWAGVGAIASTLLITLRRQRAEDVVERTILDRRAHTDSLTGLANRRAFEDAVAHETARGGRTGEQLSVVIVDVDGFKAVNDRLGHLEGDRCLKAMAGAMSSAVRAPDQCFRWGGDEFVALLPGADQAGAQEVVERLVAAMGTAVRTSDGLAVTVTAAAGEITAGSDPAIAIATADRTLLRLKVEGAAVGPRLAR